MQKNHKNKRGTAISFRRASWEAFNPFILLMSAVFICIASPAFSAINERFSPALIYVTGALDTDRAFIEMALAGAKQAKEELEISYDTFRLPENEPPTQFIRHIAEQGYSPIIAVGYQNVVAVLTLAEQFPDTRFTVIDGLVPPIYPNVQSVIFKDHEGAFLVGMIAAYASKTEKIGFIGGMDVPLIRNFANGYEQGAKFVRPNTIVSTDMIGTTPDAWSRPDLAYDLAVQQYHDGHDIIFSAAGGSSIGVLRAAKKKNRLAIGVDSNQNGMFPGHVLTSLVKRVDKAVFNTIHNAYRNEWEPGIKMLGLKENALDFAVDQHNRHLLSQDIIDQVLITRERIVNGIIDVDAYSPN